MELVYYRYPEPASTRPIEIKDPGEGHICDRRGGRGRGVRAAGGARRRTSSSSPPNEIAAGVNVGGKCCYFKGFDGVHLELLQPPPAPDRGVAAQRGERPG